MTIFYSELSANAQTSYAQLLDTALSTEHFRSVADLPGTFSSKIVKGHKYWYFQYTEPSGKLRQVFVGPDSDAVKSLMAKKADSAISKQLQPLAASAVALGCSDLLPKHLRVVSRLAEYGFFSAGGVLIGTHAFQAYGNMLGVQWGDASRTQDIDFAHAGKSISLALPSNIEVNTHDAIQSLEMGLLPMSGLSNKSGATYLSPKDPSFRLDFLTTLHRGFEAPYQHPHLNISLQPLKFMEFSLVQIQRAVMFNREGAVVVNTPHPARYALHKLIVYGEREGAFVAKSSKDLLQAASLLKLMKERRPWEVEEAWSDIKGRGKGWLLRVERGLNALNRVYPELGMMEWLVL
jgi:hypothetical protein